MRIFLVGEGPSDIGDLADEPPYRRGGDGFFQPLLRTLVNKECAFEGQRITAIGEKRVTGKTSASRRKAAMALALAEASGADLLVYAVDADNHFDRRRGDLERQFLAATTPVAVAVAKETVEAWALADQAALNAANSAARVPKGMPEDLWGKPNDPTGNHPKHVLARALGFAPNREHFAAMGAAAQPKVLAARCPKSFVPFAAAVAAAVAAP